ncbi:MAG: 3-deoxy-D-manno-octulosonic acid transferase [Xanthobacteraceae bacterium]
MASDLPFVLRAYQRLSAAATPLAGLLARRRLKRGKEDQARVGERCGISTIVRPEGPLIWIHGASVGEVLAVSALVERLRAMNIRILLTSGTVTSASIVAERFAADVIHQFIPYDAPRFVTRFLDHWQPNVALMIESDFWPNLILGAADRRIPMIAINSRISQRSFQRWGAAPAMMRTLLGQFEMCLAQSQGDADRFTALGSPHVFNTGNLKFDMPAPPADPQRLMEMEEAVRQRPVVIAASTHPGEEELILDAHRRLAGDFPGLLTILVPRHPVRGEAVADLVKERGLRGSLRSQGALPDAQSDVYVADTLGELGVFYRLSPIVVLGGSFAAIGGHNPIEAIRLGAATVHGQHVHNWSEIYDALGAAGGARRADDVETLVTILGQWLSDDSARRATSAAGLAVVDQLGGALERTLAALEPYLLQLRLESEAGGV